VGAIGGELKKDLRKKKKQNAETTIGVGSLIGSSLKRRGGGCEISGTGKDRGEGGFLRERLREGLSKNFY